MKDRWDKAQIILQIILGALGAILIPIVIVILGGIISRSITRAQIESSSQTAQAQIESSSQTARAQMTQDYISMLAQAVSKRNDRELQVILDSLSALKNMEGGIPPTVAAVLIRIGEESKNKNIQESILLLTSSEDEEGIGLQ